MDGLIVFSAQYLFVSVILLAAWLWLKSSNKTKLQMAAAFIITGALAFILAKIGDKLYYHPRPFVNSDVRPLFSHGPDNGFPSDHSWFTMSIAAVIFYYKRSLGWIALTIALIVGTARVLAHVHSHIDIAGGFAIGIAAASVGYFAAKKLSSSNSSN